MARWRLVGDNGDGAHALDVYRSALDLAERSAAADPGNNGYRRDLWFSLNPT